jgi:hypothetical protein
MDLLFMSCLGINHDARSPPEESKASSSRKNVILQALLPERSLGHRWKRVTHLDLGDVACNEVYG